MNKIVLFIVFYFILTSFCTILKANFFSFSNLLKKIMIAILYILFVFWFRIFLIDEVLLILGVIIILCLIEFLLKKILLYTSKKKNVLFINLNNCELSKKKIEESLKKNGTLVNSIIIITSIESINKKLENADVIIISSNLHEKNLKLIFDLIENKELYLNINFEIVSFVKKNIVIIDDIPFVKLNKLQLSKVNFLIKRVLDIIISIILLLILCPFMLILVLIIKIDSEGKAIYAQDRETINNKVFSLLKFRSMVYNAEKNGIPTIAKYNDERITRVGRFIRYFKIDEIPQLINVLKGDMSLVGPRPERSYYINKYKNEYYGYNLRHNVKAGITGISHIFGNYYTEPKYRYIYDLYYISNYSIMLDIKIFIETIFVVLHIDEL